MSMTTDRKESLSLSTILTQEATHTNRYASAECIYFIRDARVTSVRGMHSREQIVKGGPRSNSPAIR